MTTAISVSRAVSKQSRRSASEWRALMHVYSRGGTTRKQFCAHHGVALSTFDWWRNRLRRESDARLLSRATPLPPSALFVELAQDAKPVCAAASNWDVELELGGGVFLRLRRPPC